MPVFFVDQITGNDANNGRNPDTAWKTLDKVFSYLIANGVADPNDENTSIILNSGTYYPVSTLTGDISINNGKHLCFIGRGSVIFRNPRGAGFGVGNGGAPSTAQYNIRFFNIHFVQAALINKVFGGFYASAISLFFDNCGFDGEAVNVTSISGNAGASPGYFRNCICLPANNFPTSWGNASGAVVKTSTALSGTFTSTRCAANGLVFSPGNMIVNPEANLGSITGGFSGIPKSIGFTTAPESPISVISSTEANLRLGWQAFGFGNKLSGKSFLNERAGTWGTIKLKFAASKRLISLDVRPGHESGTPTATSYSMNVYGTNDPSKFVWDNSTTGWTLLGAVTIPADTLGNQFGLINLPINAVDPYQYYHLTASGQAFRSMRFNFELGVGETHAFADVVYPGDAFAVQQDGNLQFLPVHLGWIDDSTYPDGRPLISEAYGDGVKILSGDSCRVLGPVLDFGSNNYKLRATGVDAIEFNGPSGYNQVVDSTPADVTRTVDVRYSNTKFYQEDLLPNWTAIERNKIVDITARYFQFRVLLTLNAA